MHDVKSRTDYGAFVEELSRANTQGATLEEARENLHLVARYFRKAAARGVRESLRRKSGYASTSH